MKTAAELQAEVAAAESQLRKQRKVELEAKHREAVRKTREARDHVQKLIGDFKIQEQQLHLAHQAFLDSKSALITLDEDQSKEEYPTSEETTKYEAERQRLQEVLETKRQAYLDANRVVSLLRLDVVKADKGYVNQAYIAQNFRNQLDDVRDDENRIARDSQGRAGGVFRIR